MNLFARHSNRVASWFLATAIAGSAMAMGAPTHEIVVKDGDRVRTITVEIVDETESELIVRIYHGKIAASNTDSFPINEVYDRTALNSAGQTTAAQAEATPRDVNSEADGGERVYVINIAGQFGRDITPTPIIQSLDHARDMGATTLIFRMDNNTLPFEGAHEEAFDDEHHINEVYPAETLIESVKTQMLTWKQKPRTIAWVNRAMGGLAFMAMPISEIYFTEDGKMGGIGNLNNTGGGADEQVLMKWQRVTETQAEAWMAIGGYDPALAEAMLRQHFKIWYRETDDGSIEYWNEYNRAEALLPEIAEAQGWVLLTDTGEGDEEDTDREVVRGLGNDTLTLTSDLALTLGVSKGTADNIEDLLWELDLLEATILDDGDGDGYADSATTEMDRWSKALDKAILLDGRFRRELANAETDAQRLRALRKILGLYNKYAEVFDPGEGGPQRAAIRHMIEDIKRRR